MKFRTKIFTILILLSLGTNSLTFSVMYFYSHKIVFKQIQSKVLSIAATAAAFVDGDLHKDIKVRDDESGISYRDIKETLTKVRDANRRSDTYVKYAYTMTRSEKKPELLFFGVDAEEGLENKSHVGDIYKGIFGTPFLINELQVDNNFTKDQWGNWLSANAPIKDSKNKVIASVGIDISASDVKNELRQILYLGLYSLGLSLILSLISSLFLSRKVSRPLEDLKEEVRLIGTGKLDTKLKIKGDIEFKIVAIEINKMIETLKKSDVIESHFRRYVSKDAAEVILKSSKVSKKGIRRKVTVLFSDIRDFTKMSENMHPENVVDILNEYFETMIDIVHNCNGEIYKFIGDGLMAVFGAGEEDAFQEENAVTCALKMRYELKKLCKFWKDKGGLAISVGIGINSGNAIVGNIGSKKRMEYTVIGDTVNLASRIESLTKKLNVDILVSEYSLGPIKQFFKHKKIGEVPINGKLDPVTLYAV